MASPSSQQRLTTFSVLGDLAQSVRGLLKVALVPMGAVLAAESLYLVSTGKPGAFAFALISVGTLIVLATWRGKGRGLPVIPMLAVQHLVAYGLPIVSNNSTIVQYPTAFLDKAGWDVLIFSCAMAISWSGALQVFRESPAICYALTGYQRESGKKLVRLGFMLTGSATAYLVLQAMGLLYWMYNVLPAGSTSIIAALVSASGTCGFFLLAMRVGSGELHGTGQTTFWALLILSCIINASAFLLSTTTMLVASVMLGLFWSTGRVPWKYSICVLLVLGFFSAGKYTMRDRYWHVDVDGGDASPTFTLDQMPGTYAEWIKASFDDVSGADLKAKARLAVNPDDEASRGMLARVNNLQNLLFVIQAIEVEHVVPVYGATYAYVPQLLIPRILWPNKPRSHIGQEILNVHFGRQDLISTFSTYIAWGLLPEAYGNFGPIGGAIFLGCVLGITFAWVEMQTARKLVISLEGFLAFALMLAMANSFEMVSTVLVTSIEDSLLPIALAALPFVRRTNLKTLRSFA